MTKSYFYLLFNYVHLVLNLREYEWKEKSYKWKVWAALENVIRLGQIIYEVNWEYLQKYYFLFVISIVCHMRVFYIYMRVICNIREVIFTLHLSWSVSTVNFQEKEENSYFSKNISSISLQNILNYSCGFYTSLISLTHCLVHRRIYKIFLFPYYCDACWRQM